jgi:hypothetical protein
MFKDRITCVCLDLSLHVGYTPWGIQHTHFKTLSYKDQIHISLFFDEFFHNKTPHEFIESYVCYTQKFY